MVVKAFLIAFYNVLFTVKFRKMEFKGKIRNFHDIWNKEEDSVNITYNLSLLNMDMEKVFDETYRVFPNPEQEDKRKAYSMIILANEILKS